MRFRSKVDWWLAAVILFPALLVLPGVWLRGSLTILFWVAPLGAVIGIFAWRTTRYELTDTHLLIRSLLMHWDISLRDVRTVESTRNPLGAPALSLDRLEINHIGGQVLISPQDREGFLAALRSRAPWVKVATAAAA